MGGALQIQIAAAAGAALRVHHGRAPPYRGSRQICDCDAMETRGQWPCFGDAAWDDTAVAGQEELRNMRFIKLSADGVSAETLGKKARDESGVGLRPAPRHSTRTGEDAKRQRSQLEMDCCRVRRRCD